jgi:hypothetical protein
LLLFQLKFIYQDIFKQEFHRLVQEQNALRAFKNDQFDEDISESTNLIGNTAFAVKMLNQIHVLNVLKLGNLLDE